jgi:hypothetical protein
MIHGPLRYFAKVLRKDTLSFPALERKTIRA